MVVRRPRTRSYHRRSVTHVCQVLQWPKGTPKMVAAKPQLPEGAPRAVTYRRRRGHWPLGQAGSACMGQEWSRDGAIGAAGLGTMAARGNDYTAGMGCEWAICFRCPSGRV